MHRAECPVIIVPEEFYFPEHIILAYDGSSSSVYSIKQFAYLFPELCKKRSFLVYLTDKTDGALPELSLIEEFTSVHFDNVKYIPLASSVDQFASWLANKTKLLLVAGSRSRSELSEVMNKSFTKDIVEEHIAPVFIAHR